MKRLLMPLFIFVTYGLFANQISENLAYSSPIYEKSRLAEGIQRKKNINHITFKIGPGVIYDSAIPIFGIGYKSKISDSSLFQSSLVEFGGTYKESRTNKNGISNHLSEGLIYFPKIMGIHYFDKESENRVFFGSGFNVSEYSKSSSSNDSIHYDPNSYKHEHSSTTSVGLSLSTGVEIGNPSASINIFQIELDQPIMALSFSGEIHLETRIFLAYVVGF
jgi:hypothetical protein